MTGTTEPLTIHGDGLPPLSALLQAPADARAGYVLAHGAGAGMTHPFMSAVAEALAARRVATLRYQFPFMENASRRPDPPRVAHAAVRAAVATAAQRLPGLALVAGGKSFGGRMTSQAQALAPLAGVSGLAFIGFPLHPPKRPSSERAVHLAQVALPMLFLQGTRDDLAELALMRELAERLGARATLRVFADADHAFHVRKRSGSSDAQVIDELAQAIADWLPVPR
jgi:predicted alpha/beta-hydrolase family hydrolase